MRRLVVHAFIMAAVVMALAAVRPAAAQTSTLEVQKAHASAAFERRLDSLTATRTDVSDDRKKYEGACRGKVTTGRGIGVAFVHSELVWFAHRLEIDNETTPTCRVLVTSIKTRMQHIAGELESIDEDGRRRGIYPGVMRDLKRRYGFE